MKQIFLLSLITLPNFGITMPTVLLGQNGFSFENDDFKKTVVIAGTALAGCYAIKKYYDYQKRKNFFQNFPGEAQDQINTFIKKPHDQVATTFVKALYNYRLGNWYKQDTIKLGTNDGKLTDKGKSLLNGNVPTDTRLFAWTVLGNKFNLTTFQKSGYIFLANKNDEAPFWKGERDENIEGLKSVDTFLRAKVAGSGKKESFAKDDLRKMTGLYKIHLMPKEKEIDPIIWQILKEAEQDDSLRNLINGFKVKYNTAKQHHWRGFYYQFYSQKYWQWPYETMPSIVIYPAGGKENAQHLLEKLKIILKDFKGSNVLPRYNIRVNPLIYYAQLDADLKKGPVLNYFDKEYNYAILENNFIYPEQNDFKLK